MPQTAKIFMNGRSQAVRLPAEYRFDHSEVYIRRDEQTGDIILSSKPVDWSLLFEAIEDADIPDGFLIDTERKSLSDCRDPFEGLSE